MENINAILLKAKQKGIYNGEIRLIIINGVIKNAEYVVTKWADDIKSVDSVVDNSKSPMK